MIHRRWLPVQVCITLQVDCAITVLKGLLSFLADLLRLVISAHRAIPEVLPAFIPYAIVVVGFASFVVWNGGIVLGKHSYTFRAIVTVSLLTGDKSNHIPSFHVPQLYYFVGFATLLGWPALLSAPGGLQSLARGVWHRMFGSKRCMSLQCGRSM